MRAEPPERMEVPGSRTGSHDNLFHHADKECTMQRTWISRIILGGIEGIVATAVMSGVLALAKATGLMRNPPPKHITKRIGQKVGLNPAAAPKPVFDATWLAAHVGYGAASGVVYGILRRLLPVPPLVSGPAYGLLLWAVSYLGLMPVLGLYPFPGEDSASRQAVMIVAHGVYGASLGEAERRFVE